MLDKTCVTGVSNDLDIIRINKDLHFVKSSTCIHAMSIDLKNKKKKKKIY